MSESLLKMACLKTPLGSMTAIGNETALYLLEFVDTRGLDLGVQRLKQWTQSTIVPGVTAAIHSIEQELNAYFAGKLREFKTPLSLLGSPFQKQVWQALQTVPFGETKSYKEQANLIAKPTAYRAVANANGANQMAIVIPCHRIITSHGKLGGYAAGITKKQWLLDFESKCCRV